MSGFDRKNRDDITKVPGKTSGVTANDLVSGDPATMAPGKRNLVQTYETGVAYADKGAACEVDSAAPGCFMTQRQRDRFDSLILKRVGDAQTNYKLALVEIKVDKLIEKDEDLNWVVGLLLDFAGAQLAGAAAKALIRLKSTPVSDAAAFGFEESVDPSGLSKAMEKVSDKTIVSSTKKGFDFAKTQTSKALKSDKNAAAKTEKAAALSYIDQLKIQCDIAFDKFTQNVLATADDAQRVVIYNGLAPEYHAEPIYKAALEAKIARYHKAGIGDVGKKLEQPGAMAHYAPEIYHNKRCVWLTNPDGGKRLWFYTVTTAKDESPWASGRDPQMEQVPDEFTEAALALSEQKWGSTPMFKNPASVLANNGNVPRLQLGGGAAASNEGTKT